MIYKLQAMFSNCVHSYGLIQNTQSKYEVQRALHIDIKSCLESTVCSLVHRYQRFKVVATSVFRGVLKTVYGLPQHTPLKLLYLQTHLHSVNLPEDKNSPPTRLLITTLHTSIKMKNLLFFHT
jgi:hypothetical protein